MKVKKISILLWCWLRKGIKHRNMEIVLKKKKPSAMPLPKGQGLKLSKIP